MSVCGIDRAERVVRRLGGLVAVGAACTALPGMVSAVRERGAVSGRPELVFSPLRLLAIAAGWFGTAAAARRPLPIGPSPAARWTLLAGGLGLYLTGMGLALAGRLALGSSYRPSSSLGATLAPDHRLVTTGPFAIVRHPMYLGLMLAAVGALAVYRTWANVLFVIQLPILVVRARREDELLKRAFGEAWERYADRVPAWLPRPAGGWGSLAAATSSTPRPVSAQVRVFIARDPESVFDFLADLRNEPQYNRQVGAIRKTSTGPIGQDTTFEGTHAGLGRVTWRLAEYDRPKHVVIEGQVGNGNYRWASEFETARGGTWMTGRMGWQPPAPWGMFRPLLGTILQWNARHSFRRMAEVLREASPPTR